MNVYTEMLFQVLLDYPGLGGDWRTLELDEIEWFYNGLRPTLRKMTRPTNG